MKLIIAKTGGFCMGVNRVVDIAVDVTSKKVKNVYSMGPLIHNNQTLQMLKERGIKMLDIESPPDDSTILIRAHGIPPKTFNKYSSEKYNIIDGTCPKVKTVHKVITKYRNKGYKIIITGDEGHAEVIGLLGYAGKEGFLIQTVKDLDSIQKSEKICLVSQTTFSRNTFDEISEALKDKFKDSEIVIKKTICAATDRRQNETQELAKVVDAMVVVGGKNSANTLRLAKISKECGALTQHIETEKEIEWKQLSQCQTIGITAGASTPDWMIKRVIGQINFLARTHKKTVLGRLSNIFEVLANINFFVAAGGIAMYYASSILQEIPFAPTGALLSFLYLISIYLWNSLACVEKNKHLDISRYRFYRDHKKLLSNLTFSCIIILLCISYLHSFVLFAVMLVPTIAGSAYHFTIVPLPLRKYVKYSNLKDIPTSRELFAALAWAVLITFIPHVVNDVFAIKPATLAIFLWTFFLAYLRSLIFDLRDIGGDRIMGRETLITIIGEKRAKGLIFSALFASFVILISLFLLVFFLHYDITNTSPFSFLFQIPVIIYVWIFMKWHHKLTNIHSAFFNLLADGQFFIAGLGAWMIELFW